VEQNRNFLFFLAVSTEHDVKWYKVLTLKSGYVMTQLKFFNDIFQICENHQDLNGLTMYSISLSQAPYLHLEECDKDGKNCKQQDGYLKDYTDFIAQKLNFTYEQHSDIDGDWGTLPISGTRCTNFPKFLIKNPAYFLLAPLLGILPLACPLTKHDILLDNFRAIL
jgi:hypothetical protein